MADPAAAIGWAERSEFVHRTWRAYPRHLTALRAEVRHWLAPLALLGDAEIDLVLAVNEAASNCVEHAYTPATADDTVELTFGTEARSVSVEIVDHGAWRTPSGQPTGRGRGIEIMQRLIPVVRSITTAAEPGCSSKPSPTRPRRADRGRTGRRPHRGRS